MLALEQLRFVKDMVTEFEQTIDSIDTSTPIGLRDRALIALMVYSFARVGAALSMKVDQPDVSGPA